MILIQIPLVIQHKTSVLSLRASSEGLSKHSAGYLQYFMATYKTIGYQILVRHCGPRGKKNLKLTEAQDYCAGLAVLAPEMHGSQNSMSWLGRADLELITVRVLHSLVIALEAAGEWQLLLHINQLDKHYSLLSAWTSQQHYHSFSWSQKANVSLFRPSQTYFNFICDISTVSQ